MKVKDILKNAAYGILRSYEGMRFWPSFLSKLLMALVAATVTAFFAGTLFSRHNAANQIFSALFFYCLIAAVSKLITEIKRGGAGKRLKATLSSMVHLKPPALWFFLAAVGLALLLPYAFVLALGLLLFTSALSGENSLLLGIKKAAFKGGAAEKNGRGLAAFAGGLIACGLVVCLLTNLGVPTLYGAIDGSNRKSDTVQTDPAGKDNTGSTDTPNTPSGDTTPSNTDVIVSGDTDRTEAAQLLTDKLLEYAGGDRASFEKLFRNTESGVIDQYYNASYDTFREYGQSLIAVAADDGDAVWFTALYYRLPANYPAQREDAVYLSTIMTRSGDGWKLEWNDNVRARLQDSYDSAGATYHGLEAREQGYAWAKFFIPFDLNNSMIYYDGAMMCKIMEMYMDINNNLQITFYVANGTDTGKALTNIDFTVADGDSRLFSRSFDPNLFIGNHNATIYNLTIPSEELDFNTWNSPKITDFSFRYEESE